MAVAEGEVLMWPEGAVVRPATMEPMVEALQIRHWRKSSDERVH